MEAYQDSERKFDRLRRQAESIVRHRAHHDIDPLSDMLELIHELKIHQVELEIQNEELKQAQQELSDLHREYQRLYEFAPCGYVTLDAKGIITHANLTAVKLLGTPRKYLLHAGLSQYVVSDYQNVFHSALKKAAQTGAKQGVELQLKQSNGPISWLWMEIQAERNEAGSVGQWRMTFTDISLKKATETALLNSERKYRSLFSTMVSAAAVLKIADQDKSGRITDARIVEVNKEFEKITGISSDKVADRCIRTILPCTGLLWLRLANKAMRDGQTISTESILKELGIYLLLSAFRLDDKHIGITFTDISAHIKRQETLEKKRKELEVQVDQNAADLQESDRLLRCEGNAHKHTQAELLQKTEELKVRQAKLEEANAALKVLLRTYENERNEWEEMVVGNIEAHTRPYLDKLAAANLSQRQRKLLDAVNSSLDDITKPFSRRLIVESIKLTPSETQVAKLIHKGKSTKEISGILGVATSTINFHRHNIRRKLKLSNQKKSLQSYLQSLK